MMNKIEMSGSDFTVRADEELDYWNAAMDHCGDTLELTEEQAKDYCKKNGVSPYLKT